MAGSRTVSMPEPVCLIENDEDGKLRVVRSSQEILDRIDQHVVVVSVVGLYRTGKSYLMNKLAGKTKGFALGATIQSKTKGIWMWCVPHPKKPDHTLVLLDTEGLGDVEKGDENNDNWIFALAVLLSSTLVYNSLGTIDNNALEKLHYVTELTEHIKVKSNQRDEHDSDYMRFFPSFVWTVRDFTLQLEADGQPITSDQYLENALQLRPGHSEKAQKFNLPRSCLRNYFTPRWCFVFERPANAEKMKHMEDLSDADLEPCFVQQARRFCDHIFTKTETKALKGGMRVTGRLLGNLAETYVAAIRSGQIPCLDNAVVALALIENSAAVERARVHYEKEMAEFVTYPTDTQEDLSEIHGYVEKAALAVFMQSAFKDDEQEYQVKLMQVLQEEYKKICEKNYQESQMVCEDKIRRIFADLEEQLSAGSYMTPGGYNEYCSDMRMLTSEYRSEGGMGVKAEEVLKVYLEGKASIGHAILAADESLTEAEQQAEEEKAKREASDREARALEKKLLVQQRLRADQERSHKENVNQLTEKMERDLRNTIAEHDRVLEAKLKEQHELQQRGFDQEARKMQREIDTIRGEKKRDEEKAPSVLKSVCHTIGKGFKWLGNLF